MQKEKRCQCRSPSPVNISFKNKRGVKTFSGKGKVRIYPRKNYSKRMVKGISLKGRKRQEKYSWGIRKGHGCGDQWKCEASTGKNNKQQQQQTGKDSSLCFCLISKTVFGNLGKMSVPCSLLWFQMYRGTTIGRQMEDGNG